MKKLEIAVENTTEEIEQYKLDSLPGYYKCNRCKHKWLATLGEMFDDPTCRKCGL
jgi:Zn finger protein HypA/HybF involved in hydrogenase expression